MHLLNLGLESFKLIDLLPIDYILMTIFAYKFEHSLCYSFVLLNSVLITKRILTCFIYVLPQINLVRSSTVEVIKRPELLSPQMLQSNLNDQLHKCISSLRKPEFNLFSLITWEPIASMSHPDLKTNESQTG